ncbi:MAG: VTT domain-containing protein [Methanolinea sp.]|jgi:membrane-associated protein|nr:VTT domain-containing protein [Methanolinea sp.]
MIDFILHFDQYLPGLIQVYGFWVYLILFLIIFCETGLVFMPYLPGDSLLFVAGTLAGSSVLNIELLFITLAVAAILGDTVNYWIGHTAGKKLLTMKYCVVKHEHLEKTEVYFHKYGGMTIIIARFIPFIRTFAPFLAGIGKMRYRWFLMYNVVGGILWILSFLLAGYFFGNIPLVQDNFQIVVMAIIALSLFAVISILVGTIRSFKPCPVPSPDDRKVIEALDDLEFNEK